MKKKAILFIMLISMAGLTACVNANANASNTSDGNTTTIEMELNKNYDDTEPFVNEKLFCVSENLDALSAEGTLKMDGESIIVEVKNNKTNEVLWSNTWEGKVESESFSISLENLTKDDEYGKRKTLTVTSSLSNCVSYFLDKGEQNAAFSSNLQGSMAGRLYNRWITTASESVA